MYSELPPIEQLARRTPSDVSEHWAEVVAQVHESQFVAIADQDAVAAILVDTATYVMLRERLARAQSILTQEKVDAVLASKGRLRHRPKAGSAF